MHILLAKKLKQILKFIFIKKKAITFLEVWKYSMYILNVILLFIYSHLEFIQYINERLIFSDTVIMKLLHCTKT